MTVCIKKTGKRQIIKQKIRCLVKDEGLSAGDQILSQNQLAELFQTTPLTIVRALAELCEENILYRVNGKGTFVGPAPSFGKDLNICLILPQENLEDPTNNPECWPYIQQWNRSFIEALQGRGAFTSLAISTNESPEKAAMRLNIYDAVFFLGAEGYKTLIKFILDENISRPIIIGNACDGINCLSVGAHSRENVRLGVSHLLSLKYKRIALFCSNNEWADVIVAGYMAAMKDFGLPYNKDYVFRAPASLNDGLHWASMLISRKMPFDAVFLSSARMGASMIDKLRSEGVKIPEDIGIMSNEGLDYIIEQPPYISCVKAPYTEMINYVLHKIKMEKTQDDFVGHQNFIGSIVPGKTCRS